MTKITAVRNAYFRGYAAALRQIVNRLEDEGTLNREQLGWVKEAGERMVRVSEENCRGLAEAELEHEQAEDR